MKQDKRTQWRSLDARDPSDKQLDAWKDEFPEGASEMSATDMSRRQFLGMMGASTALAGIGLQGCIRKPEQEILPYSERPEEVIPGKARHYATNLLVAGGLQPALVESHDGRPTKIEGNPRDARTKGATSPFAQGEILRLYDPARVKAPVRDGSEVTMATLGDELTSLRESLQSNSGQGVAIVTSDVPSPTFRAQLAALVEAYPNTRLFGHDGSLTGNRQAALEQMGAANAQLDIDLSNANVIVSLDSDFLQTDPNAVAHSQAFAAGRKVDEGDGDMNRFYAVEPGYSATGMNADNHLSLAASQIEAFARALASELGVGGVSGADAPEGTEDWIKALAADLSSNRGESVIIAGERQPVAVHAIVAAINDALGNVGETVNYYAQPNAPELESLSELASAIEGGDINTAITLGSNPVYDAPGALGLAEKFGSLETLVSLAYYQNATAELAGLVIPEAHPLETWGDVQLADGRGGIQQPLIAPLYKAVSAIEVLSHLTSENPKDGYRLVRSTWRANAPADIFGSYWNRLLHDGVVADRSPQTASVNPRGALSAGGEDAPVPSREAMEVTFDLDPKILDGRYANISWLQELPHPVTKLTWDNAALMNPTTAEALGIDWEACQSKGVYNAQVIELATDNGSITMPAFVLPGVADYVVQLAVGYGQELGAVSEGAGFSVSEIRAADSPGFRTNVSVSMAGETYTLASTQDHWSLVPMDNENYARPLVREALLDEYKDNPYFVEDEEIMAASKIKSLWTEPNPREGQQWGMTIDLNSCTGCGACTVACQAENNIPSVGKERVLEGREMHWIRIDRYFVGPEDDAEIVNQPVNCMQCENAPCEQVCPVAATVHSPSGLNDMVYNRCIGTRYCANNCPYKVRRFNFFNFQKYARQDNPLLEMQRNPDVTPRFRGVMEKCTYCVQRINAARIEAKAEGNGVVPDGAVQTACQQVCPTNAIVFGAVSNSASDVSKQKRSPRNYALLSYLNTKPRTTYLAKVRNPNPELV